MYYPRNNYFINKEYNVICVIILNFRLDFLEFFEIYEIIF